MPGQTLAAILFSTLASIMIMAAVIVTVMR
jgi:hypothetical protein